IRKVVAQRAENNQKIYKKDNFYIISIEIVFFSLIQELYVPDSFMHALKRRAFANKLVYLFSKKAAVR
ncbi:hypothetical protein, partial [Staphylococcus aureus]|uniref:hypothetical protein n=2 Tax=Staphylococcus aureus TaxID=1280 RepID=UPI001C042D71